MTDEEREQLAGELSALAAAEAKISQARKPFDDAIAAIEEVRANLLEKHGAEIVGYCESCDRLLLEGDMGHRCYDGPILCEAHAPTYRDVKEQWEKSGGSADPEDRDDVLADLAAREESGGSLDDKAIYPL